MARLRLTTSPATSERMRKVPSKDTRLELSVRAMLREYGVRYRLHRKDLPGKPDIFIPRLKLAIFVNGCFWHGHDCPKGQRRPKTNAQFWKSKIEYNAARDGSNARLLSALGVDVLGLWECQQLAFGGILATVGEAYRKALYLTPSN